MRYEQEAQGDGGARSGGGAGSPLSYSKQVEQAGAILRGEKKQPGNGAAADPGADDGKGPGKGGDDARDQGARADPDKGDGEARELADERGERGADGGKAPEGERGDTAPGDKERTTTASVARALGVKEGDLFEELEVNIEQTVDGRRTTEKVTLGELRRGYLGADALRRERDSFAEEREVQTLENMHSRRFFERLATQLAPYVPREAGQILEAERGRRLERERALLYAAVPEWKDAARHAADRNTMIEFLKPWGFTASDVGAIDDHRIAHFVRDMMNKDRRARDAETRAREQRKQVGGEHPTPGRRESGGGLAVRVRSIIEQGKAAKTSEGKAEAAGALLREHASSTSRRER